MKPRCVITGSRYGLGLALMHTFREDYDIIEYDKELGQDLDLPEVRDQLIEDLRTCAIFFNNSQPHQIELLERAHQLQNDLVIVVSGTTVGFYSLLPLDLANDERYLNYANQKIQLQERCRQLQDLQSQGTGTRSWLLNLRMNWLDTVDNQDRTEDKMDPGDVAGLVYNLLGLWPRMAVQEIVLVAPFRPFLTTDV